MIDGLGDDGASGAGKAQQAAAAAFRQYLELEGVEGAQHEVLLNGLSAEVRVLVDRMLVDLAMLRRRLVEVGPTAGLVLGSYELVRRIGAGGASSVWEAVDLRLARRVAVKILHPQLALSPPQITRFERESRLSAAVDHPGICRVHDVGFDRGLHYIVQELVPEGRTLAVRLQELEQVLPTGDMHLWAARLFHQVCSAVAAVHERGITHRDIKPNNILLRPDGTPLVADFGLAAALDDGKLGETSLRLGTPFYLSPEQVHGDPNAGLQVDVFALGVSLYETLLLRRPFEGETAAVVGRRILEGDPVPPRKRRPSLPRDLETIVLHALETSPERRYPNAGAMADDLRRFLDHRPIHARPVGRLRRLSKLARRHPARVVLAVAALLLTGFAAGFLVETARLNSVIREQLESGSTVVDGLLQAADYLSPQNKRARGEEDPVFLHVLETGVRSWRAESPLELGEALATIADLRQQLGQSKRALALFDEAGALLEASGGGDEAFEVRLRQFELLYLELYLDEALEVALRLPETETSDRQVSLAHALVRAQVVARRLGEESVLEDLGARYGALEPRLDQVLDRQEEVRVDASLDEHEGRRLDLERWRLEAWAQSGEYSRALDEAEEVLGGHRRYFGDAHPRFLAVGVLTVRILKEARLRFLISQEDFLQRAGSLSRELVQVSAEEFGPGTAIGLRVRRVRAEVALHEGNIGEAAQLYDELCDALESRLGARAPRLLEVQVARACALLSLDPATSVDELERNLQLRAEQDFPDDELTRDAQKAYVMALLLSGQFTRGLEELDRVYTSFKKSRRPDAVTDILELLVVARYTARIPTGAHAFLPADYLERRDALVEQGLCWSLEQDTKSARVVSFQLLVALDLATQAHGRGDDSARHRWLELVVCLLPFVENSDACPNLVEYVLRTGDPGGTGLQLLGNLYPENSAAEMESRLRSNLAAGKARGPLAGAVLLEAAVVALSDGVEHALDLLDLLRPTMDAHFDPRSCCEVRGGVLPCGDCKTALAAHLLRELSPPVERPWLHEFLTEICEAHAGGCSTPPATILELTQR